MPERPDRYLRAIYRGGFKVPSWLVSDGTLRLMALTLPACIPDLKGIYLIEEPENGVHPQAIETAFKSMSSVYGAQFFLATHSPVILGISAPEQILCFGKAGSGETAIVNGADHSALKNWRGGVDLGTLYASGILG